MKFKFIRPAALFLPAWQRFLLISEEARRKGYGNIRKIF
ncbi:hypothetical protein FB99_02150 [Pantoea agglomerans]|nr:hypothetical protein FB99_02150 [Pantoea agglomerans]